MTGKEAGWPRVAVPLIAALAAVWGSLPVAVWWAGGDAQATAGQWTTWAWGAAVVTGLTAAVVIVTRGRVSNAVVQAWRLVRAVPATVFVASTAAVLALLVLLASVVLFEGNPRSVDGFAQLFHAKMLLAGRVWMPPPAELSHFSVLHMILGPDRWYSQYPPGQLVVLAAGLLAGAWWLLNPLLAAGLIVGMYRVGRWVGGEDAARLACLLACVSPFLITVSGSELSHLPAAGLGVAAAAAGTWLGDRRWPVAALCAGAALGVMVAFRPLDAVAAALPVAFIAVTTARRRAPALGLIALGGFLATLPTLAFNAATTGSWLEFGYARLWGPGIALGFHPTPWGVPLTPLRAVGLTGADLHLLNVYLLDLPVPAVLVLAGGFFIGRRALGPHDLLPLAGIGSLLGLLFFYFHRDVFYGPRLLFSAVPWVLVAFARSVALMARRNGTPGGSRPTVAGAAATWILIAVVFGLVAVAPGRLAAYRASGPELNLHPDRDAAAAGIDNAVVLVPDGWGSRLIARMWAQGVPVRRSGRLYARIDACTLEQTLRAAVRDSMPGPALVGILDSLAALGRPGLRVSLTQDQNLRLLPGASLPEPCVDELVFDRTGFLAFAPVLYLNNAALDGHVVWARDLRAGNAALAERYPDRQFFRYAPPAPGAAPRFVPVDPTTGR